MKEFENAHEFEENETMNTEPTYSFWMEQRNQTNQSNQSSQVNQSIYEQEQDNNPFMEYSIPPVEPNGDKNGHGNKHNKKYKALKFVAIVALGVVFGMGSYGVYNHLVNRGSLDPSSSANSSQGNNNDKQESTTIEIPKTEVDTNSSVANNGVVDMVENVMPSIVQITISVTQTNYFGQTYPSTGSGSGIILSQENGKLLVVTNYHVVEGANSIDVIFNDEKSVPAEVKGYDSVNDLAVLEIKTSNMEKSTLESIKVATLGNSDNVKVGEMAIAIGNALGYGQSVTVGYVSAKDRIVDISDITMVLLQTDAAINPGNSGGALFNSKGEVIGINSAKLSDEAVEGMGYAIPISKAIPIINDLMTREILTDDEKGYLGIAGQNVDEEASTYFNMPAGVFVNEVAEDGAAALAGIKVNDIITKINDVEVTSIQGLAERVNSYRKGTEITITLQRQSDNGYKEVQVKVTLKGKETLDDLDSSNSDSNSNANGNSDNNANGENDQQNQTPNSGTNPFENFPWDLFE